MSKYVKTTKGIYELKPNSTIEDDWLWETREVMTEDGWDEQECLIGKVLTQSDNLNELIEYAVDIHKDTNKVSAMYPVWLPQPLDIYRRIGVIKIGDDLLKVADWNSEKGEWKLYER